jgi:hypothetical protein
MILEYHNEHGHKVKSMHTDLVKTVHLRFTDKQSAIDYIENTPDAGSIPRCVDMVGLISNNDGVLSDDGEVITPSTFKEGYHVNIYTQCDGEVAQHASALTVVTPSRKAAGT